MADIRDVRDELAAKRQAAAEAASALFVEQERLRRIEREARQFDRRFDDRNQAHRATRDELAARQAESRARVARLVAARDRAAADLAGVKDRLEPLTDPRRGIAALDARFPILLFPVRLETRFVGGAASGTPRELLVRVYPDDCLVDSFEPDLSETEVKNLRRYWCGIFKAGGDEGFERAAWRELCAVHGAGRAVYLVGQYAPLAGSDLKPVRARSDDVLLAMAVDAAIANAPEKAAIVKYWKATWRAGNDEAAFATLSGEVGDARAEEIRTTLVPFNIKERPQAGSDRATVRVEVVFVEFTPVAVAAVKRQAWTRAPRAELLPDRFVLVGDSGPEHIELLGGSVAQPLAVGPDPLAEGDDQFSEAGADLNVPAPLKWMTDFDAAIAAGLAFRVPLTPRQSQFGFDRLFVIGVRLASGERTSQNELEQLIQHQFNSQSGFAIVPQGAPTNNTEDGSSGWSRVEEADALFPASRAVQAGQEAFDASATAAYEKKDGLALAEALGIGAGVLQQVPAAGGTDQAEARAMNAALWPATLGYWMDTQMRPVFDGSAIERTRRYFIDRVLGRGKVPAVRVGRQPYGVLPTTAFSRIGWLSETLPVPDGAAGAHVRFLRVLHRLMTALGDAFWRGFGDNAPHVGQATLDPQKLLLDIIGLHPSSVDFHVHVLDSADRLWNELKFRFRRGKSLENAMRGQMQAATNLLGTLGYSGADPEIVEKFESYVEGPTNRPVIDSVPLSETEELTECTDGGLNYIEWCRDKAEHAFDDLRQQVGFTEGKLPNALLYHMLRHALQLGYHDAAVNLHVTAGLIAPDQVAATYKEPAFVHVAGGKSGTESRYGLLYGKPVQITGDPAKTVFEVIPGWVDTLGSGSVLADQLAALRVLERVPTARLERAFAEHIDLCTYRWDAWMLSLVNEQLNAMRRPQGPEAPRREGLYLGAYGWLEHVTPDPAPLQPVTLTDDLKPVFETPGQPPLERDPANGGHVLAPSLNHAVTAAVLRNGYLNNASPANPDLFAVDLSSARVRVARQFIEGIRNGQPLGALLGYQFERRLHDRHAEAETDEFIYQVRQAFPLVAKRIADSVEGEAADTAIENIEARNVCDGLLLLEHVRGAVNRTYPWDKTLDRGTAAQEDIINQEVAALFDIHDAIADVAIAESVHQVTMGNADRAAAAMDAYAKSTFPPEPDVVATPRTGTNLTHRIALHLPVDAAAGPGATPRAEIEPAVDRWLSTVLPAMSDLVVRVRFTNAVGGAGELIDDVSMQALGFRPVDLLYVADPDSDAAMNDLDDRIARRVIVSNGLAPDAAVSIRYTEPVEDATQRTWFETAPAIASLRNLILNARPLKPSDAALETEASTGANAAVEVPAARVTLARTRVDALRQDAAALTAALAPLTDPAAAFGPIVNAVDAAADSFHDLQRRAGLVGVTLAGSGQAMKAVREWFLLIRGKAHDVAAFWTTRLADCDAAIAEAADPATPESLKVAALQRAERAVSTSYSTPPPDSATFLPIVTAKRTAFQTVKTQVEAVETSAAIAIRPLWTEWTATFPPRQLHDITVIDTSAEEQQIRVLVADMHQQLTGLVRELEKRVAAADDLIAASAASAPERRAQQRGEAVSALFGEGFRILPRFTLSDSQADEWQNAFDARASLLTHASAIHDFPVDGWLYGIARVRAKMHDLEKVIQVAGAFDLAEPSLDPIQLPFRAGEPWLALEVPSTFDVTLAGEHLLYSAIYTAGGFDKTASAHGGLLLDEWTEIIPGATETAGLAFHYDRPSSEPPHAMLLVTPASLGENWHWEDVERAIPETFALAKTRAAEPRDVSATPLARLLPATLMAFTTGGISIGSQLHAADVMFAAHEV